MAPGYPGFSLSVLFFVLYGLFGFPYQPPQKTTGIFQKGLSFWRPFYPPPPQNKAGILKQKHHLVSFPPKRKTHTHTHTKTGILKKRHCILNRDTALTPSKRDPLSGTPTAAA